MPSPIESAILALNPRNYWKLNEQSGSTFADVGSSPRPLTIVGGSSGMGVEGPETGTYGWRLFTGASATSAAFGIGAWADFSVMFWSTQACNGSYGASPTCFGLGPVIGDVNRGFWWRIYSGTVTNHVGGWQWQDRSLAVSANVPWPEPLWHLCVGTYQFVGNPPHNLYYDQAFVATNNSNASFPPLASDIWWINTSAPVVLAHMAYFTRVLTLAEIQSVGALNYVWPYGIPANAPPTASSGGGALSPTDPVIVDINLDLSDIRAAVIRTYPKVT